MWLFNTGDCLIQVTAWAGLTIYIFSYSKIKYPGSKINHGGMNTKCLHRWPLTF